jgi:type I restriction enzyme S subunit
MTKPYSSYKKSKFKWFDNIPEHWIEAKVAYLFKIGRGRVISELELIPDGKYPVYSSQTKNDGCMGYIDTFDFDDSILTWTTDGANAGTVFIRSGKFNCTNVCGTLKAKSTLDLKYYFYYLQVITQFYKRPDTNGAKIMNNEMADIYTLSPTYTEQIKIAQYLDHQTAIIDQLIAQKEKLIELLKEKRLALIKEAVTKGLNPNAKMKYSGIEWLGEVPVEWEFIKLKFCIKTITGGGTPSTTNSEYWNGDIPWVSAKDMKSRLIADTEDHVSELGVHESSSKIIPKYSVLIVVRSGILKHTFPVAINTVKVAINQDIKAIEPLSKVLNNFLYWYLKGNENSILSFCSKVGATVESIDVDKLLSYPFPLIPTSIQEAIVVQLEQKVEVSEKLISSLSIQIEKLKEYRQAIISEAVIGKIDVRDWEPNKQAIA